MEMMAIDSLEVESGRIVIRGKLMKNMPTVIHVQAIGLAELFMLLTFKSFMQILVMFCKGMWQYITRKMSDGPAAKSGH